MKHIFVSAISNWAEQKRTLVSVLLAWFILLTLGASQARAGEVVVIDYTTSFEQELTLILNGKEIAKTKLPRSWMGSWVDSVKRKESGLKRGQNKLEVKYRVIKRNPQIPKGTGPNTFKVTVKLQKDQTKPSTAKTLATVNGPNPIPKVGTSSKKEAKFNLQ